MLTASNLKSHSTAAQSGKVRRSTVPRTFSEAIATGFRVAEEHLHGTDLNPRGHFILQRIDKATGDCERISVPCKGTFTVGPVKDYRVVRHAYLTPEEVAEFAKAVRA